MFDMHYDLLTLGYVLKNNKEYLEKVVNDLNNNLVGLIANLYFMDKERMALEFGITDDINVEKMFNDSLKVIGDLEIYPKMIFGIEGCDYIEDYHQLERLKTLGLRAIIPVWNNKSKYGSGYMSQQGLTADGIKLIRKAIDLKLGIDLSHANEKTFFDIIELIKESDKEVVCYVSHANIYSLWNHPRNLTDEQVKALREVGGYLGIVSYPRFLTNSKNIYAILMAYLKHIKYAVKIMGIDRVMLSSDNMDFYEMIDTVSTYDKSPFKYEKMEQEIRKILQTEFETEEIDKIMYKNAMKIYWRLMKK